MNTKLSNIPSALLNMITNTRQMKPYLQFDMTKHRDFLAIKCPVCHEEFGLSASYVEKIGETSYLMPYSCPYCHVELTLK